MGKLNKNERSRNMSRISSKNTAPEVLVRSFLHKQGFRFRIHSKAITGHPDIVLTKLKTIIEVRGCFWHRHKGCTEATMPKTNTAFWKEKLRKNQLRDRKHEREWKKLGWNLIVIWTCELENKTREQTLLQIVKILNSLKNK